MFPTEMTQGRDKRDEHNRNHLENRPASVIPQKRPGDEVDMAGAVLFLCSRAGWYCDGAEVLIDGGRLKTLPILH